MGETTYSHIWEINPATGQTDCKKCGVTQGSITDLGTCVSAVKAKAESDVEKAKARAAAKEAHKKVPGGKEVLKPTKLVAEYPIPELVPSSLAKPVGLQPQWYISETKPSKVTGKGGTLFFDEEILHGPFDDKGKAMTYLVFNFSPFEIHSHKVRMVEMRPPA